MNDSNNMFGNNNNVTPTPQPVDTNGVNPTPQQSYSTVNTVNDEDLLRAFIGNNYEKITTRHFNIAAFFFNSLYMCYRKMFGYGILTWLVYLVLYIVVNAIVPSLAFILSIGLCVVVGLFVNKIYLSYAKKKIAIIKASNPQKSNEELKTICARKGGTSVGEMFSGFLIQFGIALVAIFIMTLIGIGSAFGELFNANNWNITTNGENVSAEIDAGKTNTNNGNSSTANGTLVENVSVRGYRYFGSKCSVTITNSSGNDEEYTLGINNSDLFSKLGDYSDYIKLDIYYTKKGSDKTIVNYKIYSKSTNEDISNVKTEGELRDKLGLYSIGTHTESLKLVEIGTTGFGLSDDTSYTYKSYTFADSKNVEYEMKYINDNGTLNLIEGKTYNVTFEVTEGTFDYEFTIKSIN